MYFNFSFILIESINWKMSKNHHQSPGNHRQLNPNADNFVPKQQQNAYIPPQLLARPVQHPHGHQFPMQQVPFPNPPGNQFPRQQGNNPMQYLHQNFEHQNAPQNLLHGPTVHMHQVMSRRIPQLNPPDNQFPRKQGYNPMQFHKQNFGPPNRFHRPSVFQGSPLHMRQIQQYVLRCYPPPIQSLVPYPSPVMHDDQQIWMNQPTQRMVGSQARFQSESLGSNNHRGILPRSSRPNLPWRTGHSMGGSWMQLFKRDQELLETKSFKGVLKLCKGNASRSLLNNFLPDTNGLITAGKIL